MLKYEKIHMSKIERGDTVLHRGKLVTVGKRDLKHDLFWGYSFLGDPYIDTKRTLTRVLFPKWYMGEVVGWLPQV